MPGQEWERRSLSLEAFTDPAPGLDRGPPGLLGEDLVSILLHFLAGRRPAARERCGAVRVWAEPEPGLLSFWVCGGDGGPSLSLSGTAPGCPAAGHLGTGHSDPSPAFLARHCCAQVSTVVISSPPSRVLVTWRRLRASPPSGATRPC